MTAKPVAAPAIPPLFAAQLRAAGVPSPTLELRFHPTRKWRWDMAWVGHKVALEIQGGLFINGRHSRGAALLGEHEKLSEAAALGWRVLFTTPRRLCLPSTVDQIRRALAA